MFKAIEEFLQTWKSHFSDTQKYMNNLTDSSLNQESATGERTLPRAAWHIVTTIPEMAGRTGLKLSGPSQESPIPKSAKEIASGYRQLSEPLMEQVKLH